MNLFSYINIKLRVVAPIGIKVIYLPHTDGISTTELREGINIKTFL